MWLDTDLPPLSIPQNLNQILAILNQAKTHAHKQNPWSAFQKTGKHKGQTYLMTQLFYNNFIFLSYNQAHVCFQTAITRSTLHPLLSGVWEWDEVLFVTFSAVHQTYGITLRLWDHNRLPRITSLPYVNVQWNVSCSKDTKCVSEDLRYLQHFIRIVLKWLENKFQSSWSSLNYLLPKKNKSAFQMKISCRTLPIYPQCLMPNIFWLFHSLNDRLSCVINDNRLFAFFSRLHRKIQAEIQTILSTWSLLERLASTHATSCLAYLLIVCSFQCF